MFKNLIPSCTAVSKPGFLRRCAASPQFAPHNSRNLHKLPLFRNQRCFWHPNESTHLSGKPTFLRPLFIRWPLPAGNCTANSDIHTQVVRMFSSRGDKKTRSQAAAAEKEKYMRMTRTEKRKVYRCGKNYNTLEEVPTWPVFYSENKDRLLKLYRKQLNKASSKYEVNEKLNNKISIWKGDITTLESDSIVNAANSSLLGGGGVDGAIHGAAGSALKAECALLQGCETGDAKITGGYKLPSKYVIHTVGPIGGNEPKLRSCYQKCLQIMAQEKLRSVAFPCISTGIYGYPNEAAAPVALESAREFLEKYSDKVDRIIFCLFMRVDVLLYEELMQYYFPIGDKTSEPQGKAVDETKAQTEQSEDDEDSKENEKVLEGVRGEEREPEGTQDTKLEDIKDDTTTENVTEDDTKRIKVDSENGTDEAVSCHKKESTGAMEGETENTTPASEHQEPTSAKEEQPAASETKLTASDTDEATVTEMKESSASDIEQPDDTKMTTDTEMKDDTIIKTKL